MIIIKIMFETKNIISIYIMELFVKLRTSFNFVIVHLILFFLIYIIFCYIYNINLYRNDQYTISSE